MEFAKQEKPVIVLDVGKVLIDYDQRIILGDLTCRAKRGLKNPPLPEFEAFVFSIFKGERHPDAMRLALNDAYCLHLESDEWLKIWCRFLTEEIPGMRGALAELKARFRLVALSNTDPVHWAHVVNTFPIFGLLDGWVLSFEERVAKPDPAIFKTLQERFCQGGLPAYYTDDIEDYVRAARDLGWDAEVFRGTEHFRKEIKKRQGSTRERPA